MRMLDLAHEARNERAANWRGSFAPKRSALRRAVTTSRRRRHLPDGRDTARLPRALPNVSSSASEVYVIDRVVTRPGRAQ